MNPAGGKFHPGLITAILATAFLTGCVTQGSMKTKAFVPLPKVMEEAPLPQALAPVEITVQKGDSLWRLARRAYGCGAAYWRIAQYNGIKGPGDFYPGLTLKIPFDPGANPCAPRSKTGADKYGAWLKATTKKAELKAVKKANPAYAVGEKLTFAVQYFGITAGYATLSIPEYAVQAGRSCFHIVAEAQTHPFFDNVFKVRDRIETFLDTEFLMPWRYEKHLREGKFSADTFFIYDQRQNLLFNDRSQNVTIPAEVQDIISCFYLYRSFDLKVGREDWVNVAADDMKNYELQVKVLRREEKVEVLAGKFDCLVVQPFMKFQGVFQQKGEVFIWMTDDARHMPVMVKTKIALGTIDIILQDAELVQPQEGSSSKGN
jgi:hypothetical protein